MLCKRKSLIIVLHIFFFFWLCNGIQAAAIHRKPVTLADKHVVPLRVLSRPFSNIYSAANEKSAIIRNNVPAFSSYIVYTKPTAPSSSTEVTGWYEVGSDDKGNILGWMKATDVMEWKQALCLSFSHPLGRKPVLMFKDVIPLLKLINLPPEERKAKSLEYYAHINDGRISPTFPVVAMEPAGVIDIIKQFYFLPILEYTPVEIEGREARLIKLTSALKEYNTKKKVPASVDPTAKKAGSATVPSSKTEKINMDIVFVIDMTNGMQPYVEASAEVISNFANKLSRDPDVVDRIKFGLWGYRDSTEIPDIEFDTKNFTEKLLDVNSFAETLTGVKVAQSDSADYAEDVFSGIDDAMRDTSWRNNALHFMILIGDAPGHTPGHKWNISGHSAGTLRIFANENNISIAAIHIRRDGRPKLNEQAEKQFRLLSRNPGTREPTYFKVSATEVSKFTATTQELVGELVHLLQEAPFLPSGHSSLPGSNAKGSRENTPKTPGATKQKNRNMGYACLVSWLGRQKSYKAPRDVTAWVTDKDLIDPSIPSFNVRVLLNKNDLNSLKKTLEEILTAGRRGKISGENFFDALVAVATLGVRDPEQIRNAENLAATGLLPEFMVGLPYKSHIMEMNNELWSSMSVDQQQELLNGLETKIQLYEIIYDSPGLWISLTPGADEKEKVYPLPLESLP